MLCVWCDWIEATKKLSINLFKIDWHRFYHIASWIKNIWKKSIKSREVLGKNWPFYLGYGSILIIKIQLQKYHNIIKKKVHRRLRVALVAGWNHPKNTVMKLNNLEDNDR